MRWFNRDKMVEGNVAASLIAADRARLRDGPLGMPARIDLAA